MSDISSHTWLLLFGLVAFFLGGQELLARRGRRKVIADVVAATREDVRPGYGAVPYVILTWIDELRDEEGASVEFYSDNADFNGMPARAIAVTASWTNWEPRDFRADLFSDCFALALDAKKEAENG